MKEELPGGHEGIGEGSLKMVSIGKDLAFFFPKISFGRDKEKQLPMVGDSLEEKGFKNMCKRIRERKGDGGGKREAYSVNGEC